jgi:putative ABC transport system permease protein
MSVAATAQANGRWLPLRYALRELRGGLSGFYVFISCIALGSMAIAGVGSLAASLGGGLAREGQAILGGDVAFSLIQREASADERKFLEGAGTLSVAATLRAMARSGADGKATLVEMKAVDGAYPLFGQAKLDPVLPLADVLAQRDGAFGAAADPTLLARLDIKPGARLTIGSLRAASASVRACW